MFSCRSRPHKLHGFSLLEFLITLIIIGILVALLLPAVQSSRGPGIRAICRNHLKQIGIALHNYHDTYESFPPAFTVDENGNRLHSWRTLLLPFIDQEPLYDTIDLSKPWDDAANASALERTLDLYQCHVAELKPAQTTYMAIVGENYAFDGTTGHSWRGLPQSTSETIMLIEVSTNAAVHWMSPRDIGESDLSKIIEESTFAHDNGLNVLFADGRVLFLSIDELKEVLIMSSVKSDEAL